MNGNYHIPDEPGMVQETLTRFPDKTVADLESLPEGTLAQLINGELVMSPAPTLRHQLIVSYLIREIGTFVAENKLGVAIVAPLDVQFSSGSVFQPDLIFVPKKQLSHNSERLNVAPALVIEVLSPSTAYYDLVPKYKTYEEAGVEEYWIVDPLLQIVRVHVNGPDGFMLSQELIAEGTIRSTVLEGLEIDAARLFAQP